MNCLVFGKLKACNVLSIGPEVEYDFRNGEGLTYIYGINNDNEGTANGCGKCLRGDTNVEVEITDPEVLKLFQKVINAKKA